MPFLAATTPQVQCVDHGQANSGPNQQCCTGLNQWQYDANTGQAYNGFMCWTAPCASAGQYAPPASTGGPGCCPPLVNVNGKCGTATTGNGGGGNTPQCASGLMYDALSAKCVPISVTPLCQGTIICSIPDMYLYAGMGVLVLFMVMSKKKAA